LCLTTCAVLSGASSRVLLRIRMPSRCAGQLKVISPPPSCAKTLFRMSEFLEPQISTPPPSLSCDQFPSMTTSDVESSRSNPCPSPPAAPPPEASL
jgi:hypothetical protein